MKNKVRFGTIRFVKFVSFVVTSFLGQTRIALTLFRFYPCQSVAKTLDPLGTCGLFIEKLAQENKL